VPMRSRRTVVRLASLMVSQIAARSAGSIIYKS
jgi:hypothetical protein